MDAEYASYGVTPEELAEARRYGMAIDWSPEDKAFLASFPDVPGVVTHGATREEAAERGEEVIVMWLTAMRDTGLPVPPPVEARPVSVQQPPLYGDPARIRAIRRGLGVSQRVFADLLNVSLSTIRSWEQGLRTPDGASRRLLSIAERHPDVLLESASPSLRRIG
jgi:predicted RNase H-like HicB family nuclease/DNA-binding XRE family transcriptional regulator